MLPTHFRPLNPVQASCGICLPTLTINNSLLGNSEKCQSIPSPAPVDLYTSYAEWYTNDMVLSGENSNQRASY